MEWLKIAKKHNGHNLEVRSYEDINGEVWYLNVYCKTCKETVYEEKNREYTVELESLYEYPLCSRLGTGHEWNMKTAKKLNTLVIAPLSSKTINNPHFRWNYFCPNCNQEVTFRPGNPCIDMKDFVIKKALDVYKGVRE